MPFGIISIIASRFGTSDLLVRSGFILALLSRGGSNAYPKNTVAGLILNAIGIFIGAMMILISIITIASFGSIDNFMNAAEQYLDHYYSTLGSI